MMTFIASRRRDIFLAALALGVILAFTGVMTFIFTSHSTPAHADSTYKYRLTYTDAPQDGPSYILLHVSPTPQENLQLDYTVTGQSRYVGKPWAAGTAQMSVKLAILKGTHSLVLVNANNDRVSNTVQIERQYESESLPDPASIEASSMADGWSTVGSLPDDGSTTVASDTASPPADGSDVTS